MSSHVGKGGSSKEASTQCPGATCYYPYCLKLYMTLTYEFIMSVSYMTMTLYMILYILICC